MDILGGHEGGRRHLPSRRRTTYFARKKSTGPCVIKQVTRGVLLEIAVSENRSSIDVGRIRGRTNRPTVAGPIPAAAGVRTDDHRTGQQWTFLHQKRPARPAPASHTAHPSPGRTRQFTTAVTTSGVKPPTTNQILSDRHIWSALTTSRSELPSHTYAHTRAHMLSET